MKPTSHLKQLQVLLFTALIALPPPWAGIVKAQDDLTADPQRRTETDSARRAARPDALDRIIAAGVIRIAVPDDLPLFGSIGADKKLEGYDIDVASLLARDLGVKLQLVPVKSVNRISWLMSDRVDLVVANLGISPERAKSIAFSAPYVAFFSGVFGAPGIAVKGPADLQGKRVAVTRDTLEDAELAKIAPKGVEILRFDDNSATISAFIAGKADLVATGSPIAAAIAKANPEKKIETKFIIRESPGAIGVRRGEPELLHWVNVFVYHKKLGGDLDRLSRKWFGEPLRSLPPL